VIIAADDAYFSLPEIDRGGMGGAAHMMRMLPLHKVRALFFTVATWSQPSTPAGAVRRSCHDRPRRGARLRRGDRRQEPALVLSKQALNGIEATDVDRMYRLTGLHARDVPERRSEKAWRRLVATGARQF
jgi:enoyl-CoA hydratase